MSFCNTYRWSHCNGDQFGTENGADIGKTSPMNPSKPDSEEDLLESVDASTVLYSFRLAWKIPLETLLSEQYNPRKVPTIPKPQMSEPEELDERFHPTVVENSKPFVFEDLKIHPFYLELSHEKYSYRHRGYNLKLVSNDKNNGILLNFAFVSYEDVDYYLNCYGHSVLRYATYTGATRKDKLDRDTLRRMSLKQKYVTIMCQVTADIHFASPERMESESLVFKCSFPEEDNTNHCLNYPTSMATQEAICKYLFNEEIPKLNVGLAKELLTIQVHIEKLKTLSEEFLIENLNPENIASVLNLACRHRLQRVINECIQYMTQHCKVIEKVEDPEVMKKL